MTVEVANFVNELDRTLPTDDNDFLFESDDHHRLIKNSLLNSFANIGGAVTADQAELNILDGATLSTAELNILDGVTVTATELNSLTGITGNVETRLDALEVAVGPIEAGTVMLFMQNTVPTGWTFSATNDDRVILNTSTFTEGGDLAGSWTVSGLTMPHDHSFSDAFSVTTGTPSDVFGAGAGANSFGTSIHTHAFSGSVSGTTGAASLSVVASDGTWRPSYVKSITCTKD